VERVIFKNQFRALFRREAILNQREIQTLVTAVKFVADDGMAEVREVDPDLMFAPGAGNDSEQGKSCWLKVES
jgi:hypothetical protein